MSIIPVIPKKPKKPVAISPLFKPSEMIKSPRSEMCGGYFVSLNLSQLIKKLPPNYPLDQATIEVTIEVTPYKDITLRWNIDVPNPNYDYQMKAYKDNLPEYNKRVVIYEKAMKIFLKEKEAYDLWYSSPARKQQVVDARVRKAQAESDLKRLQDK